MKSRKTRLGLNREHADRKSAGKKPPRSLGDRITLGILVLIGVLYAAITFKLAWEGKLVPDTPPCPPPQKGAWPDCH